MIVLEKENFKIDPIRHYWSTFSYVFCFWLIQLGGVVHTYNKGSSFDLKLAVFASIVWIPLGTNLLKKAKSNLERGAEVYNKKTSTKLLIALIIIKDIVMYIIIGITIFTSLSSLGYPQVKVGTLSKWEVWGVIMSICVLIIITCNILDRKLIKEGRIV